MPGQSDRPTAADIGVIRDVFRGDTWNLLPATDSTTGVRAALLADCLRAVSAAHGTAAARSWVLYGSVPDGPHKGERGDAPAPAAPPLWTSARVKGVMTRCEVARTARQAGTVVPLRGRST